MRFNQTEEGTFVYDTVRFDEKERWGEEIRSLERQDVYYHLNYCLLYRSIGDGDPYLFVYEAGDNGKVVYPFLKRKVNNGPLSEKYYDITTPYGYGGPMYRGNSRTLVSRFRKAFHHFCQQENIVSEFIRFDPLLKNEAGLHEWMDVQYVRDTVFIDLQQKDLLSHYHPSHRRNVRKAMKAGFAFGVLEGERALGELDQFVHLYYETMEKNKALPYYYFPRPYFEQILHSLKHNVIMAVVRAGQSIAAAGLFMYGGDSLHYHLGCSDRDYLRMAPNNLLFHEVALWGQRKGFKYFHLGGGYRHGDSLFQFKQRFNPSGRLPFYVGRAVHNQPVYDELIRLWKKTNAKKINTDFFPLYRQ